MTSPWIVCHTPRPAAKVRLFCFPHAGGAAWAYGRWAMQLPSSIDVLAIELPGHGNRIAEAPQQDFDALLRQLVDSILPELDRPVAFFGHSFGAVLAFEVARKLPHGMAHPLRQLFVSGHNAPHVEDDLGDLSQLNDEQLIDQLRRLNCTPPAALENHELMELMLPVIRADFALYNSYVCEESDPLGVPITVLNGLRDPRTHLPGLQAWRAQTTGPFVLRQFVGDHFFVSTEEAAVVELVGGHLLGGE